MKWIKYKLVCNESENILVDKKLSYNDANLLIAQKEAYNGEYEIVQDSESFTKEPLPIELGGTGATNNYYARINIGAAPAGFGLGGNSAACRDCNEALESGFYRLTTNCANAPGGGSTRTMVVTVNDDYIIQVATNGTNSARRIGFYDGMTAEADFDGYGGWKWDNPPMVEGETYLTTEQWKGKNVYTKLFTFGKLPNTTARSVSIGKNLLNVRVDGFAYKGEYTIPIQVLQKVSSIYYHKSDGLLYIETTGDYSDWTACLVVKWTN